MRILALIGLASLALAVGNPDAEARGFRIRFGGLRTRTPVPATAIRTIPRDATPAPGLAVRSDMGDGARPTYVVLPPSFPPPEPADARSAADAALPATTPAAEARVPVAAEAEAAPWCRSLRIVGTGAGFCLIN